MKQLFNSNHATVVEKHGAFDFINISDIHHVRLYNTSKHSNDVTTALSEMTENTLLCYILMLCCTSSINTYTCTIT